MSSGEDPTRMSPLLHRRREKIHDGMLEGAPAGYAQIVHIAEDHTAGLDIQARDLGTPQIADD